MRSPISSAPLPGCWPGRWSAGLWALKNTNRKPKPGPRPVDVRKLFLLLIPALCLALVPLISGAEKIAPKRATRPAKPAEAPAVRRWLAGLTLSQKVAQLVVIPFYGEAPNTPSRQHQRFLRLVRAE